MISIRISLEFTDAVLARMVEKSLRPDNKGFPDGLTLSQYVKDGTLRMIVDSSTNVDTLLNTIDEMLAMTDATTRTIGEI